MTVFAILILCFIVARKATRSLHCFITLGVVVVCICVFHFSELARFIPRICIWFVLTQNWYRFVSVVYIGSLNLSSKC